MIIINGTSLTVEQVAAVARTGEQVAISDEAKAAVNKARAYVEKKLDEKAVVYGLTTGFGKFSDKYIGQAQPRPHQGPEPDAPGCHLLPLSDLQL